MKKILITGASGNVGTAILRQWNPSAPMKAYKAVRNKENLKEDEIWFDFENSESFSQALKQVDILFLLRPPQLTDIPRYFSPLIKECVKQGIEHIIFLSVQGAETVKFIPHAKIEKLILESRIPYTFLRPSYFMQNLSSVFREEISKENQIDIPAGKAKFLWVNVDDIGRVVVAMCNNIVSHRDRAYTITGKELLNFDEVADLMSQVLGREIQYKSSNALAFFFRKYKQGIKPSYIIVMILLHMLPRFQKLPEISDDFKKITGLEPSSLKDFILENRALWIL